MTVFRRCQQALKNLPRNSQITRKYSDPKKFSGILVFDGKYLNVKGYPNNLVLLWGTDFLTHDFPHYLLAPSENYQACLSYFSQLKGLGYVPKIVVCDDNDAIKMAVGYIYPQALIQTCQKHFLENIRVDLKVRSSKEYENFVYAIEDVLKSKVDPFNFNLKLQEIDQKFNGRENERISFWLGEMLRRKEELLNYQKVPQSPWTTNLIETFNSHLEGRLKTIKGFQSFHSADLWLNGYVLRRRLKPFTDCEKPFKHLNGKPPLQNSLKIGEKLPSIFN